MLHYWPHAYAVQLYNLAALSTGAAQNLSRSNHEQRSLYCSVQSTKLSFASFPVAATG